MNTEKSKNKGVITIELLIAFAVFLINITGIMLLASGQQSLAVDAETNAEAISMAQRQIEDAKAISEFDFNLVSESSSIDDIYTKDLKVRPVDLFTKEITSAVNWLGEKNRNKTIKLTTLVTNPEALDGGDTCSSVLKDNWENPAHTIYEFGADILENPFSAFPITSIQTFNKKMYITVNNESSNTDETFFILDISATPILNGSHVLGRLDNSPVVESNISEGLSSVAVDGGNYAYVANAYDSAPGGCEEADNCAQLQVISINDPLSPAVVRNVKINSFTNSNELTAGKSIFYQNGLVYLGLAKASLAFNEFYILDVGGLGSGTPISPQVLASFKIGSGINSIFVRDGYAYIASPEDEELKIFDVSNPTDIEYVGGFNAPGGGGNNGNGKSLYLIGTRLYLGRTLLSGEEFYILDNTDPETNLPILGSKDILDAGSNISVNGVIIRNYLAFLATNSQLQILNISDPANIVQFALPLTLPGGLPSATIDCEDNFIYVGSKDSDDKSYLSIITGS